MTTYNDIRTNFYRFENSNVRGNDLQRMGTQTLSNCLRSCYNDDDCLAFTTTAFDNSESSGDCNLKRHYTDTNFYPWWGISEDTNWKIYVKNINKRRNITRKNWDKTGFNRWFPEFTCIRSAVPSLNNSLQLKDDPSRCGQIDNVHLTGSDIIKYNCQTIDSDKMCFVTDDFKGTCAVSPCEFSNDTNKGWWFYTQDQKYGSINCKYSFDYTNFSFNNLSNFVKYINTLYSDYVKIDTDSKHRFRDSNYIYACILDFYSSIYGQYYYSQTNAINRFKNFNYLKTPLYQYKNTNIFPIINTQIQKHFTSGIVSRELQDIVDDSLQLPSTTMLIGNPNTYKITLNIPYLMYKEYKDKDQQSRDTYISRLLEGFLRDREGKIFDRSTGNSWVSNRCDITFTSTSIIYALNVSSSVYNSESIAISPDEYETGLYGDYLFLYCTITGTVNTWTPMLSVYFQNKSNSATLDTITCEKIAERAGYNSVYSSLYPYTCFQRLCTSGNKDQCINVMVGSCRLSYVPPSPFTAGFINRFITNADSQQCQCYTSGLSPSSENQVGNIAAMCFDKKCQDPDIIQTFNLSDSNCKQYVDKVWNWIYNPNTEEKSKNSQSFDTEKFNRLTGTEYQPYQPKKYNWEILAIGIFTTILVSLITFILCKTYHVNTIVTIISIVIIILICGGLTAFFSIDMAGLSSCENNEFKCKSRYTGIELPNEFCNYTLNCECTFNEDCSPCSYCFSGTCAPASGIRKTITVSKRKPNVVILILCLILLVLLPLILVLLYDENILNIPKWLFSIIILISCLIPLVFIVYNSFKKIDFTEYDGSCRQECNDSCEGKTCGYNECGGSCGICNIGYNCNEKNVCELI
jgi:hypothetical protein